MQLFSQSEFTRVKDGVIWMEISYLDSPIDYRDALPKPDEVRREKFTFPVSRKKSVKYGAVAIMLLIGIAGLALAWIYG